MLSVIGWFVLLLFGLSTALNSVLVIGSDSSDERLEALGRLIIAIPVTYYTYMTLLGGQ